MFCSHEVATLSLACTCLLIPLATTGATPRVSSATSAVSIDAAEQAERDTERLRILTSELTREQARADEAVRRRAERLAMNDPAGVADAEAMRTRLLADIAALQREIAAAGSNAAAARTATPSARDGQFPRQRALNQTGAGSSDAPWWDVYSRAPRAMPHAGAGPPGSATALDSPPVSRSLSSRSATR